jgi:ribonuclease HII
MLKQIFTEGLIEAGCDEAGRGCLAGAVFAAAVILPPDFYHPLLNDSKQVSEANRTELRKIIEQEAIAWEVARGEVEEIDRINILKTSFKAMHKAIDQLKVRPELLLIDGHIFPAYLGITHRCIVKGDSKYASIAAASILAKTYRDEYMMQLHSQHPQYKWQDNKGYGTAAHLAAIKQFGITEHHRKTFAGCK